jgi:hypothetical protein
MAKNEYADTITRIEKDYTAKVALNRNDVAIQYEKRVGEKPTKGMTNSEMVVEILKTLYNSKAIAAWLESRKEDVAPDKKPVNNQKEPVITGLKVAAAKIVKPGMKEISKKEFYERIKPVNKATAQIVAQKNGKTVKSNVVEVKQAPAKVIPGNKKRIDKFEKEAHELLNSEDNKHTATELVDMVMNLRDKLNTKKASLMKFTRNGEPKPNGKSKKDKLLHEASVKTYWDYERTLEKEIEALEKRIDTLTFAQPIYALAPAKDGAKCQHKKGAMERCHNCGAEMRCKVDGQEFCDTCQKKGTSDVYVKFDKTGVAHPATLKEHSEALVNLGKPKGNDSSVKDDPKKGKTMVDKKTVKQGTKVAAKTPCGCRGCQQNVDAKGIANSCPADCSGPDACTFPPCATTGYCATRYRELGFKPTKQHLEDAKNPDMQPKAAKVPVGTKKTKLPDIIELPEPKKPAAKKSAAKKPVAPAKKVPAKKPAAKPVKAATISKKKK